MPEWYSEVYRETQDGTVATQVTVPIEQGSMHVLISKYYLPLKSFLWGSGPGRYSRCLQGMEMLDSCLLLPPTHPLSQGMGMRKRSQCSIILRVSLVMMGGGADEFREGEHE